MRNLIADLSQGLTRTFKVTFTILFIVINLSVISVNTIYINDTMKTQNESLLEMLEHLITYTDETTALTYLEHYGHTHAVYLDYTSLNNEYTYVTEKPPREGERYTVMVDQTPHGILYIDNAQSNLLLANLTYLVVVNAILIALYVVFMLYFNRTMKKQNKRIIDDFRHLLMNIDTVNFTKAYTYEEIAHIEKAFESTIRKMERLQNKHHEAIQSMAHEIKTPLTIIRGLVEGIAQGRIKPDSKVGNSISEESRRISTIIEKIIEGRTQTRQAMVNLSAVVRQSLDRQRLLFEQKGITLKHNLVAQVNVSGNRNALRQVLEHLLQNSLTHTPSGGVVQVYLNTEHLEVRDSGKGMTPETLAHIFEPTESKTGSGVGLTIVKNIVDSHGFIIEVDSRINQGTRIKILFDS